MKIHHIFNSRLAALLGYSITLYPFIFYIGEPSFSLMIHELTHIRQIKEEGVFKFYFKYLSFYLTGRYKGLDHETAYLSIPYEVEAYAAQAKALRY